MSVYSATGVHFCYRPGAPLLTGLDLEIEEGDFLGLVGPNGTGKSTLIRLLTASLVPQEGHIRLLGQDLRNWGRREIARQVAVVPQTEYCPFGFTVEEIVLMGRSPHLKGFLALDSAEDCRIAREALRKVGLENFATRPIEKLSGGERQMVLIARAFAQQPRVLLLDEPTASLDITHQQEILRIVERDNRDNGLTVVFVTHELNLAGLYCKTLAVLSGGRLAARGTPREVINEEILGTVYGADIWFGQSPDGHPLVGLKR